MGIRQGGWGGDVGHLVGASSGMSSLACCFSLVFLSEVAIFSLLFQCFSTF
jgi:hypothetical protein